MTNNGTIDLKEGGFLNFTRGLALGPNSIIRTELAGTAMEDYGRMSTSNSLAIDGALEVMTTGGFTPMNGDIFNVVGYPSATGDFASFDDGGTGLAYAVNANSVSLGIGLVRNGLQTVESQYGMLDLNDANEDQRERALRNYDWIFADWNAS